MRLFYRSFYSFIALILFQAVLTVALVTSITDRNNHEDARQELKQKASISYDAVTGWIRSLWKEMITIQDEGALTVTDSPFSARGLLQLEAHYRNRLFASGFDYFVIRHEPMHWSRTVVNPAFQLATVSVEPFSISREHPTIRYYRSNGATVMVGGFRLYTEGDSGLDLFVTKHLDDDFCRFIAVRSGAPTVITSVKGSIAGSLTLPALSKPLALGEMELSYQEHEPQTLGEEQFRTAVKRLGHITPTGENLYLVTLVSDRRYADRIRLIARTTVVVSAVAALLSAFLSLFLSRYLSRPAKLLLAGMRRVKSGALETQLNSPSRDEFSALFRGFNSMAAELREDRKRMNRYILEITQLKEYNEAIIHSIRAGIAIINHKLRVETANTTFAALAGTTGGNEGKSITGLGIPFLDEEIQDHIYEVVSGKRQSYSKRIRTDNDRVYDVKLYALTPHVQNSQNVQNVQKVPNTETSGCVLVVEDVTSRDNLENKMYQAEKIASISLLSAGVAHEINNPLSSITTNVQNLITDTTDPDQKAVLTLIDQETHRIAQIVRKLLDFATTGSEDGAICDAAQVADDTAALVRSYIQQDQAVKIVVIGEKDLPEARIGKDVLRQVLINLLLNSIHAVGSTGHITVRSQTSSDGVMLQVTDDGCGIPEAHKSRIFDPFFTTKPNGQGTGLGLSVVYGVITQYGGTVRVESREGRGTTVELHLPGAAREVGIHG